MIRTLTEKVNPFYARRGKGKQEGNAENYNFRGKRLAGRLPFSSGAPSFAREFVLEDG